MSKFFISIVSHGHEDLLVNNADLIEISKINNVHVVIKDNLKVESLGCYCDLNGLDYLVGEHELGFGENNNSVFEYCFKLGMSDNDWFLIVNPDVFIGKLEFLKLMCKLGSSKFKLHTIDLYKDVQYLTPDNSLRYFPKWSSLLNMLINKPVTNVYDKNSLSEWSQVEWASGAFLIFKVELFRTLSGFDKKYFMYYEDVDICYRANVEQSEKVSFIKTVRAQHYGAFKNRKVFSQHFRWYFSSLLKFLIGRRY